MKDVITTEDSEHTEWENRAGDACASVAAGVSPAVEGGVPPPGIPWFTVGEPVGFEQGTPKNRHKKTEARCLAASVSSNRRASLSPFVGHPGRQAGLPTLGSIPGTLRQFFFIGRAAREEGKHDHGQKESQ